MTELWADVACNPQLIVEVLLRKYLCLWRNDIYKLSYHTGQFLLQQNWWHLWMTFNNILLKIVLCNITFKSVLLLQISCHPIFKFQIFNLRNFLQLFKTSCERRSHARLFFPPLGVRVLISTSVKSLIYE